MIATYNCYLLLNILLSIILESFVTTGEYVLYAAS
jgi:hypothetical protein